MIETASGRLLRRPRADRWWAAGSRAPGRRLGSCFALAAAVALGGCGAEADLEEPVPLFQEVPIEYPLPLWDEGVEGTTVLRVWVSEGGSVDSTRVLESSGHDAFDSAAVRGGRQLRFEPARREGEPVAVWAEVPVHFSLDGGTPSAGSAESAPGASDGSGAEAPSNPSPDGSVGTSGDGAAAGGVPGDGS